ncbi:MAG: hypothetical protein JNK75_08375 [Betaproteobacteria bacterium]|nr:hypothetical protein [Betaproteobacteria bacterium]
MKKVAVMAMPLMALFENVHGMCLSAPSVEVQIEVMACHAVSFGSGLELDHHNRLVTSSANVAGLVLSGTVKSSVLKWRNPPPHRKVGKDKREPKAFQKGTSDSFFVVDSEFKNCPTHLKEPVRLLSFDQCCDTLPRRGTCAVPQRIYQLVTHSVETWPVKYGK